MEDKNVNGIPFKLKLSALIHEWCLWCVAARRVVDIQEWCRYTHSAGTAKLIIEVYAENEAQTTVFLTFKNADLNEGRGPMVPDRCFKTRAAAEVYIDGQPGVQGRRRKWSEYKHGDWEIKEIVVE